MNITETTILNEKQFDDVQELFHKVHRFDNSFRMPYLSNQYNFFPEMPAFILGYKNDILIGFSMLYADESPEGMVDIYLCVLPEYRQRGYGSMLKDWSQHILGQYGYKNFEYISEMNFLDKNPSFLENSGLKIDPESEYQMRISKTGAPKFESIDNSLKIQTFTKEDISDLAKMSAEAFDSDINEVTRTLEVGLEDKATKNIILIKDGRKIGFGKVDVSDMFYLYNIVIDKDYRNQGFGTSFVRMIVQELFNKANKDIVIGVDKANIAAVRTYQKAGFVIETEIVYLIK